ncbi:hypothetical protein JNJ66_01145 [Candidatus Saccharibacteria bacterium]|nr:hypothetical protein [Candidatus Saccharibacteria bacterium]
MKKKNTKKHASSKRRIGDFELILIALVLIFASYTGWYVWRANDSQAEAEATLSAEIDDENTKIVAGSKGTVRIPELNVKLSVPGGLKDLTYSIDRQTDEHGTETVYAYLSSETMLKLDDQCAAEGGALGVLKKSSGRADESKEHVIAHKQQVGDSIKQLGDHYLTYTKPQAACGNPDVSKRKQQELSSQLMTALQSATLLQ